MHTEQASSFYTLQSVRKQMHLHAADAQKLRTNWNITHCVTARGLFEGETNVHTFFHNVENDVVTNARKADTLDSAEE